MDDLVCEYCGVKNENYDTLEACLQKHLNALQNDDESGEPETNDESGEPETDDEISDSQLQENDARLANNPSRPVSIEGVDESDDKIFKCSKCSYKSKRKHNLVTHLKTHDERPCAYKYECAQCSYKCKYKHDMKYHMRKHITIFDCSKCSKTFGTRNALRQHKADDHSGKQKKQTPESTFYQCSKCQDIFKNKKQYKTHARKCNFKILKCDQCFYRSSKYGKFQKHLKTHMNASEDNRERKIETCLFCSKRFTNIYRKQKHMKENHASSIEYQCHKCQYILMSSKSLRKHVNNCTKN